MHSKHRPIIRGVVDELVAARQPLIRAVMASPPPHSTLLITTHIHYLTTHTTTTSCNN